MQNNLAAVANLKVTEVSEWRRDGWPTRAFCSKTRYLAELVDAFFKNRSSQAGERSKLARPRCTPATRIKPINSSIWAEG